MRRVWTLEACEVDLERQEVRRDGASTPLTPQEVAVFELLAAQPGRTVSRDQLLRDVWGFPKAVRTRAVDHALSRLRAKIEHDPGDPRHIVTSRGTGYRFEPPDDDEGPLIGRAADLRRLDDAVAPLVTLTGPAGVGKTALLRAWSRVPVVDLVGVEPDALPAALADALGVPIAPAGDPYARLGRALRGRDVDLVAIDGAGPALRDGLVTLMTVHPGVRVVATAAGPLAVPGEHVVPLRPLAPDAAARLLVRRAATPLPAPAARAVAEATGGLPLAIELAAARLRRVNAADLPALAADPETLRAEAGARYPSLRAALDATWDQLPAALQTTLATIALFGSGVPADALPTLLGCTAAEAWRRVDALVDHGLLTDTAPPAALDLVRRVALEHADPALVLAQARWLRAHPDPIPALAAAARVDASEPALAAELRLSACEPMLLRGPVTLPAVDAAVTCAIRADDPTLLARALVLRGALHTLTGALDAATADLSAAARLAAPDAVVLEARVRGGWVDVFRGRAAAAAEAIEGARRDAAAAGHAAVEAMAHVRLASLRHYEGAPRAAVAHLQAALGLYEALGDEAAATRCRSNLGLMHLEQGDAATARDALLAALEHDRAHGIALAVPQHLLNLGGIETDAGRPADALRWLDEAHAAAIHAGDDEVAALALLGTGVARLHAGEPAAAIAALTRARQALVEARNTLTVGLAWAWLGAACALHGDPAGATAAFAHADAVITLPLHAEVLALCRAVADPAAAPATLAAADGPRPSVVRAARRLLRSGYP